jgi:hypothetical protein
LAGHVAWRRETRFLERLSLGRLEDIKMDLSKIGCENMNWIEMIKEWH